MSAPNPPDDFDFHAYAIRPRDGRPDQWKLPDARTLGRRLAVLRWRFGISVEELADTVGLRRHQVEEFEQYGVASAETLLWLIQILCRSDGVADAFMEPCFSSREEFLLL